MDNLESYKKQWFNFSDYTPHVGQLKMHYPPEGTRFIVACCGRRWGKSFSAAMEAEIMVTQPNKTVWIVHQIIQPVKRFLTRYGMTLLLPIEWVTLL